jgi:hypothetical protein
MMIIDEAVEAFRLGAFETDCHTMVLKQRVPDGEIYKGKGYVKQDTNGVLIFKIYVTSHENAKPFRVIEDAAIPKPGNLFTQAMFYDLAVTTTDGTPWKAEKLIPSFNWDIKEMTVTASGQISSMKADLKSARPSFLQRIYFFEELDIPLHGMSLEERDGVSYYLRSKSEFKFRTFEFEVRKLERSKSTVADVSSSISFPEGFHLRVKEALQYMTGVTTSWRALVSNTPEVMSLELASPSRPSHRTRFSMPLTSGSADYLQHGWEIFSTYLAYVLDQTKGAMWNPVAYHLLNAREASANSVDAAAIGVSVALEALASLVQTPSDPELDVRLDFFRKQMQGYLSEQAEFSEFSQRMDGLLNTMGTKRPQDVLHLLARAGGVEGSYIQAWSKLRNRHVHPKLSDLKPLDVADQQCLLDRIRKVEVLVHQLVFHLIGYRGPFTDYGSNQFPTKQYPLPINDSTSAS